jgi:hypothetical protein
MNARLRDVCAAGVLVAASACTDTSCWWTDGPHPDPWVLHQPERAYRTEDGAFEIVLHADGQWPPTPGIETLRIEWHATDPRLGAGGELSVARPFQHDGELVADVEPIAVELESMLWRIERLELAAPGRWSVPIVLTDDDVDDSFELHLEVVDPED